MQLTGADDNGRRVGGDLDRDLGVRGRAAVGHEGQVRVWWDDTPIDLFFGVQNFHGEVAAGVRTVPFAGEMIPVLGCMGLAVFKALFNRT